MTHSTRTKLAEHGLNCTQQRAALYEALRATRSHPTAEELFQQVRSSTRSLSLATVYSALETFCRVGLVRRLATDGSARYDAATGDHVHVRELDSGRVSDVPDAMGDRILENLEPSILAEVERELGVRIEGVDVQLLTRPLG